MSDVHGMIFTFAFIELDLRSAHLIIGLRDSRACFKTVEQYRKWMKSSSSEIEIEVLTWGSSASIVSYLWNSAHIAMNRKPNRWYLIVDIRLWHRLSMCPSARGAFDFGICYGYITTANPIYMRSWVILSLIKADWSSISLVIVRGMFSIINPVIQSFSVSRIC